MNKNLLPLLLLLFISSLQAQFITESGDTLYGNEWIDYDQEYYKIPIAEDGMYRIPTATLESAGVPVNDLVGGNFQMIHNGKVYPIYVSTSGDMGSDDFIEFYGRKNRGELDRVFYEDPDAMQLNPDYSLFTDTAAYFLTWNSGSGNLRVNEVVTPAGGGGLPEMEYYMHKERVVFSERAHKPTRNGGDNVRYSHFDVGEGFGGALRKKNTVSIKSSSIFQNGPSASVDIRFTTNATSHDIALTVNGDLKNQWQHSGYLVRQESEDFSVTELKATNSIVLEGLVDNVDRNIISVVDLNYPREFDFENEEYFEFYIDDDFQDRYAEVNRFGGGDQALFYDPASASRILPELLGNSYGVVIPGAGESRNVIAYNSEMVREVSDLEKMSFVNYDEMNGEFIIISHPKLMKGSVNKVAQYASYRSSAAGGNYGSVVVNVEDLYEQFSYGIHRHSYSVKNFVNWASRNWDNAKYVFILGKGREYADYRTLEQIQDPVHRSFYIPTYGRPGSDNLLVSRGNIKTTHVIPTGRIAAKDVDDVALYLEKVTQHENFDNRPSTLEDRLWKKRVMHLAGAETTLQESIGSYLQTMEEELERSQYGARVTTFRKSSTETIQEADAQELLDNIDQGLSILTFFGHSSVGTFDFNIDDVNKLKNFERYPLVISLGCFSGNVHTQSYGISEQYVLTAGKGAIAFMASSSTAYVAPQGGFGIDYYEKLGNEFYGATLAEVFKASLSERDDITTIHSKILNEQMTLHGDPAIRLFSAEAPDYVFDHKSFKTEPNVIESNESEFELSFRVVNLGRFQEDSLSVSLQHFVSDGSIGSDLDFKIKAPDFDTLITMSLVNPGSDNVGRNVIKGELDKIDAISEAPAPAAEDNNILVDSQGEEGFTFFSINNSAVPVSPCDFGIYHEEDLVLRASTFNALAKEEVKYIMQLDTTALFNSPSLQVKEVLTTGGLIEWEPDGSFENGRSYYWRISPDSLSSEIGYRWEDASFVYLPNSSNGWNQSHYYQFLENEYDGIKLNSNREFTFDTSGVFIKIFNAIYNPNTVGLQFNFETFASSVRPWLVLEEGVAFFVRDHITNKGWVNSGGDYGSINSSSVATLRAFAFKTETFEDREKVINFIENVVPEGDFIFFFTVLRNINSDFDPGSWLQDEEVSGKSIFTALEDQGAVFSRELIERGSVPYTVIFEKNKNNVISEEIAEEKDAPIVSSAFIPIKGSEGKMNTIKIGPSRKWDKLLLNSSIDSPSDTTMIKIFGYDSFGEINLLLEQKPEGEVDLSFINAEEYPYITIELFSKDESKLTTSQLNFWRVLYEGLPDFGLSKEEELFIKKDTLQQGEILDVSIRGINLTQYHLDSLPIEIIITSETNEAITHLDYIKPLSPDETVTFNYALNTSTLIGKYQLTINVNANNDIEEKNYFNNFGLTEFVVISDKINPVLDVSFDGTKIMEGDIVSPNPEILISLKDENEFLLLDDPTIIEVAIIHPDGSEEIIDVNDERLSFSPATNNMSNEARLEFLPVFEVDGIYKLEVLASDRSENISGDVIYQRNFEVINEQMVSEVLNYPNPFSTSTEFVFTLTGSEIPDELKIQILTVSGKVVKEIHKEELGSLRIGVNRTSYKYDGSDDFGNLLANGVYLYRVVTKLDDNQIDIFQNEDLNHYFKNSLGKMVILR